MISNNNKTNSKNNKSITTEGSVNGLYGRVEVPVNKTPVNNTQPNAVPSNNTQAKPKKDVKPRAPRFKKPAQPPKQTIKQNQKPSDNKLADDNAPKKPAEVAGKAAQKPAKQTRRYNKRKPSNKKAIEKPSIKISFLGGLNEIGKNITLFECNDDMFILDCGMAFPDGDMLGVDLVLPDFTYIEENKEKIRGIVLTHGHEDHIGSLPYLLKSNNFPIYGTPLTLGLVGNKLKEHNLLYRAKLNVVHAGDRVQLGCMEAEFIHVNHSIPDASAIAIHSPAGTIVHTGDFKIDCTPTSGTMIDLARFAELGKEGVLALLAESTNAERPGYTMTEQKVSQSFESLFQRADKNRIIIATFASNVNRVQQIINCAHKHGRKVAFSGRSMLNYMSVAQELGYLEVPEGVLIDIDLLKRYPAEKVVLVTTGSQGEPMSALSRMAYSDHRKIEVGAGDFIIISANPIPGNEKTVGAVVDELLKLGCEVVYESMYEVHVSGHACQEELKIIHGLTKPKYFIPVHGEQKHLRKHTELAVSMGMDRKNIFIGDVGNVLEINENYMKQLASVPSGKVFVDGLGVGDVGSIVLRDRKHLGQDGLIIIVASLDIVDGHVVTGPDIVSRGFVYVRESEALLDEVRRISSQVLEACFVDGVHEWNVIKTKIKDDVSKQIYNRTRRSPMILPIIMEV
ncbi:MAG TPA: RNase J family beta-CASP ribonuclease [Clostridiales bacterium]|nr:RNase J family beta-CASP ribonuclease [Clostridiales bacterium]